MDYNSQLGVRRELVDDIYATSGNGLEIPDGRVLYVYVSRDDDDHWCIRRGYSPSVTAITRMDHTVVDIETISTSDIAVSGSTNYIYTSISYVGDRLLLLTLVRGSGVFSATGFFDGTSLGWACHESFDDGDTWVSLGAPTNTGFGTNGETFGTSQPPGTIIDRGDGVLIVPGTRYNDFFGTAMGGTALYYSSDGGATWTIDSTITGVNAFAEPGWSQMVLEVGGTFYLTLADIGGGLNTPAEIWSSPTGVEDWTFLHYLDDNGSGAMHRVGGHALQYSVEQDSWWVYWTDAQLQIADFEWLNLLSEFNKIPSRSPDMLGSSVTLYASRGGGVLAFGGRYVDLLVPSGGKTLPALRIPWPRWAITGLGSNIDARYGDLEWQNYIAIEQWWDLARKNIVSPLIVPFKRWAVDAGLDGGGLEEENYQTLERWATAWNASPVAVNTINLAHGRWARALTTTDRGWVDKEAENYLAIERAITGAR